MLKLELTLNFALTPGTNMIKSKFEIIKNSFLFLVSSLIFYKVILLITYIEI